jgi:hypothetical protein
MTDLRPAHVRNLTAPDQMKALGCETLDDLYFYARHGRLPDRSKWRDDGLNTEGRTATISTIVRHAEDVTGCQTKHYALAIAHVMGFHGRGFMPSLTSRLTGDWNGNGEVFYVNHLPDAYEAALAWGVEWIRREQAKDDERWAQMCREQRMVQYGPSMKWVVKSLRATSLRRKKKYMANAVRIAEKYAPPFPKPKEAK